MPYLEYQCPVGHREEKFFRSISAGEEHPTINCLECGELAERVPSTPLGFGLYGNPAGYDKPSATKRFSNKSFYKDVGKSRSKR